MREPLRGTRSAVSELIDASPDPETLLQRLEG
jgi:hypothetical protein